MTDMDALAAAVADEPVAQAEHAPSAETPATPATPATATPAKLPPLRIVGQVGMTYIVAESPEGMYMIDQHATHERIAYERLMAQRGSGPLDAQELLMAETVNLPSDKSELLLAHGDILAEWGFSLDAWGEGMVRVRAVPAILHRENLQTALLDIADRLAGEGGKTPVDWREELLITLACHSSVRAGQSLSLEEMRELLRQLERCENPRTCPHGRPTMVLLTPGELEKQFGRRV
jgi:DNA mismatch repair protein MutL